MLKTVLGIAKLSLVERTSFVNFSTSVTLDVMHVDVVEHRLFSFGYISDFR